MRAEERVDECLFSVMVVVGVSGNSVRALPAMYVEWSY